MVVFSATSTNISKESLPNDISAVNGNVKAKNVAPSDTIQKTTGVHDDFGDIVDWINLSSVEKEKAQIDTGRLNPVVVKDAAYKNNPTLAEAKHLIIE